MADHGRARLVRRDFLIEAAALLGMGGIAACSKASGATAFACTDVGGLSETDRAARSGAGYTDRASDPEKRCASCHQFMASDEGCGGCKLIRGPVHPFGTCRLFASKG